MNLADPAEFRTTNLHRPRLGPNTHLGRAIRPLQIWIEANRSPLSRLGGVLSSIFHISFSAQRTHTARPRGPFTIECRRRRDFLGRCADARAKARRDLPRVIRL